MAGNLARQDEWRSEEEQAMLDDLWQHGSTARPLRAEPLVSPEREAERRERQRREDEAREEAKRQAERRAHARKIYKAASIQRRQQIMRAAAVVLVIGSIFTGLVMRQGRVMVDNFANTKTKHEISDLQKANAEEYQEIMKSVDMNRIAQEAERLFGLRKPVQSQRITIAVPKIDRSILYDHNGQKKLDQQQSNYYVIENFVKEQRDKHGR